MTRINLIHPEYLTNRHLVAEYTEIRHVPQALLRSSKSKMFNVLTFPEEFTLNKGHVRFFYPYGKYMEDRFYKIQKELIKRGFNLSPDKMIYDVTPWASLNLMGDWKPSTRDLKIVCDRIMFRISQKPHLYPDKERFINFYNDLLKDEGTHNASPNLD